MPYKDKDKQRESGRKWAEAKRRRDGVPKRNGPRPPDGIRAARNARQDEVSQIKLSKGCSVCGYKKCSAALHFHHVSGDKSFTIRYGLAKNYSRARVEKEMGKCVILCANCHAEAHQHGRYRMARILAVNQF